MCCLLFVSYINNFIMLEILFTAIEIIWLLKGRVLRRIHCWIKVHCVMTSMFSKTHRGSTLPDGLPIWGSKVYGIFFLNSRSKKQKKKQKNMAKPLGCWTKVAEGLAPPHALYPLQSQFRFVFCSHTSLLSLTFTAMAICIVCIIPWLQNHVESLQALL